MMKGQAPLHTRLQACARSIWAIALLIFIALVVVFAADFWSDFHEAKRVFYWRIGSFAALAVFFASIAQFVELRRGFRWAINDGHLELFQWGDHSGTYTADSLRLVSINARRSRIDVDTGASRPTTLIDGPANRIQRDYDEIQRALRESG